MDQRSILVFLHLKGLSAKSKAKAKAKVKDVHTELVQVLGPDAIAYSTTTKYIRKDAVFQNEPEAEDRAEAQGFLIPDNAILEALEMKPFASIPRIAQMNFIPPTAVFRRLTKSLHFVLQRLRLVPHRLSDLRKEGRAIMSSYHHVKGVTKAA
jgi:hypothetical protein